MSYYVESIVKNICFIFLLLLSLSGCHKSTPASHSSIIQSNNMTYINSVGNNYRIQFSPSIENMPLNRYFEMDVYIKGFTHQTLHYPVTLNVDAGMKAHNHGMNTKPNILDLGNGHFKVEGMLFHMPGKWFLNFTIYRGAVSDYAEINLFVRS